MKAVIVSFILAMALVLWAAPRTQAESADASWIYLTDGKNLPSTTLLHHWAGPETTGTITDEGLLVDVTKTGGRWYFADWNMMPGATGIVEARLKTFTCEGASGNSISVADGLREATVTFFPDRIEVSGLPGGTVPFNTTDGLHDYRIEIQNASFKLFADGKLLIDGTDNFTAPALNGRIIAGFGCGASNVVSKAVWGHVRYQVTGKAEQALIEGFWQKNLKVDVGSTVVIIPAEEETSPFFSVFQYRDGRIVVSNKFWSKDLGQSWQKGPDGPPGNEGISAIELDNGDVLAFVMNSWILGKEPGWYNGSYLRFKPDLTVTKEDSRVYLPDGSKGLMDDDNKFREGAGGVFDHNIVLLPNGDLIATMFGNFENDRVQIPYFDYPIYKYRTWAVKSTDQGKTWKLLATIAYDPEVGMESFCEPALLRLPDGDLLCAMRVNGRGDGEPVYLSRSTDDGNTWSKPEPVTNIGVYPNMVRLENGVIVMTYGRPHQWLAFSLDNGKTWQGHICYSKYRGSDYNFVVPVGPDKVMAIYYRGGITVPGTNKLGGEIVGTVFTVIPTAPAEAQQ